MRRIKRNTKSRLSSGGNRVVYGLFKCDYCGKIVELDYSTGRRQKSCGCLKYRPRPKHGYTSGGHIPPLYNTWRAMKQRCLCGNHPSYIGYGTNGISICDEWIDSFETFAKWAEANGYKEGLMIDRIDNEKGYFPENCRWVTALESGRNRRSVKLSKQMADEIRFLYATGKYYQYEIAEKYGVCQQMVGRIVNGKAWR